MECFMGLWETQMVNHPVLGYIQCFERNQRLLAVNGLTACGIPTKRVGYHLSWLNPNISIHLLLTGPNRGRVLVQIFLGSLTIFSMVKFPWCFLVKRLQEDLAPLLTDHLSVRPLNAAWERPPRREAGGAACGNGAAGGGRWFFWGKL